VKVTLIRFALLNVQGLVSRRINKLQSPELSLFTETWTNEYSDLRVENYEHYVLNRTEKKRGSKRSSGGIIILPKKKMCKHRNACIHC